VEAVLAVDIAALLQVLVVQVVAVTVEETHLQALLEQTVLVVVAEVQV
jgi:hypothetical protein